MCWRAFDGLISCAAKVHFKESLNAMTYLTLVNGMDFRELVFLTGAESSTDTFKVALAFGKDHTDVLRKHAP